MEKKILSLIIVASFFISVLFAVVEMPNTFKNVLAHQSDSNQQLSREDSVREVYKNPEVEPRSSKEISNELNEEEQRNSQERSNELNEED